MEEFGYSFRAMDTEIDIVVEASSHPADVFVSAQLLFERAEAKFSRFRPDSLLSKLNNGGQVEDAEFARACALALDAFEVTGGAFNPMVLPALEEAGYSRSFERVTGGRPREQEVPDPRRCLSIHGDRVRLPAGRLDLAGLVKGWSVDRCFDLLATRVERFLVNAGGDLRCKSGCGRGWELEVDGPGGKALWTGAVPGAMATSSTARRSWRTDAGGQAHHLIDPSTGLPAQSRWQQVTARGEWAWRAEAWAKAVLIAGPGLAEAAMADGYVLMAVGNDGAIERFGWPE